MNNVGIIGYAVVSGLGLSVQSLKKHLGIQHHLVIPHGRYPEVKAWAEGPGVMRSPSFEIPADTLTNWVNWGNLKTVISVETMFGGKTFETLRNLGVKTILFPMGEWWTIMDPQYLADLYVCVSDYTYSQVPANCPRVRLPWPVDTEEIQFRLRTGPPKQYVHNAGNLGVNGRKGTMESIIAFSKAYRRGLGKDYSLEVRSQQPLQRPPFAEECVRYKVATVPNYADLYKDGDMLLYPAQMDGHALVVEEALAAGLPSIVTEAEPMNEFHQELGWSDFQVRVAEVRAAGTNNPNAKRYHVDFNHFAEVLQHVSELDMAPYSRQARQLIEDKYSWDKLRESYREVLQS